MKITKKETKFVRRAGSLTTASLPSIGGVVAFFAMGVFALFGLSQGCGLQGAAGESGRGSIGGSKERTERNDTGVQQENIRAYTREVNQLAAEVTDMAESIWQAGNSGDFDLATNWSGDVPGTVSGVVGILDGTSQTSLITNVDQSGATFTFQINSSPSYRGNIGAPGKPLVVKASNTSRAFTLRGTGDAYVSIGDAAVNNAVIIDSENSRVVLDREGVATYVPLMVKSGNVTVENGAGLYVTVGGFNTLVEFTNVMPTNIIQTGGEIISSGTAGYAGASDKSWIQHSGVANYQGLLPTEMMLVVGGTFNYNPSSDPTAETPDIFVLPSGHFDASEYNGTLTLGRVIIIKGGRVSGSIIDQTSGLVDYDLNEDWP